MKKFKGPIPAAIGLQLSRRALAALNRIADGAGKALPGSADQEGELTTLIAHDLVRRDRAGGVRLTPPGLAYLKRLQASQAARQAAVSGDFDALGVIAPYRDQHEEIEAALVATLEEKPQRRFINRRECPLAWLYRRRDRHGKALLEDHQFEAGMRFRSDFERGGLAPRVTSSWAGMPVGRVGGGGKACALEPGDAQLSARHRFRQAVQAMGPGLAETAIRVCCTFEGLEEVEKAYDWPARSGKVVLGLALSRLAEFYGYGKK